MRKIIFWRRVLISVQLYWNIDVFKHFKCQKYKYQQVYCKPSYIKINVLMGYLHSVFQSQKKHYTKKLLQKQNINKKSPEIWKMICEHPFSPEIISSHYDTIFYTLHTYIETSHFEKHVLNPKWCGLLGGVLFGEMKFVLSNFLSNEDLSISNESWDVQLTFDTLINAFRFKA